MAVTERLSIPLWAWLLYAAVGLGIVLSVEAWVIPYAYFFPLKVAIIPVLLMVLASQRASLLWLWLALLFSWLGDVVIHFHFLGGVGSFLLAHVAYTYGFYRWRERPVRPRWWAFFSLPVYIGVLMGWLLPHTGEMTLPVLVYALAICAMLIAAIYVQPGKGKMTLLAGAILFVVSDSVLAIDKFAYPFEGARVLIMTTYMLAQILLVAGVLRKGKK